MRELQGGVKQQLTYVPGFWSVKGVKFTVWTSMMSVLIFQCGSNH